MNDLHTHSAWKRGILASVLHVAGLGLVWNSHHEPTQVAGLILFVIGTLAFILCCVSFAKHKRVSPFLGVLGLLGIIGVLAFVVWFQIHNKRGCLIVVFAVVAAFCAIEEVLFLGPARRARKRVENSNHEEILTECRKLMSERSQAGGQQLLLYDDGRVLGENEFPKTIAKLDPIWVIVRANSVSIGIKGRPAGVFVTAYATNTTEYGWRKIIDGLWYD